MQMIQPDRLSREYRSKLVDASTKSVLITNFAETQQAADFSEPSNCHGYGRIRHFSRETSPGWVENPLPMDPASWRLGLPAGDAIRAQVFQNAACNWRCWYCYVPFNLLSADRAHSDLVPVSNLVDWYLAEQDPAPVLDLSGGQPDLAPEWIPWMMEEIERRGASDRVYIWSDDNLSNDYFWRYLGEDERRRIQRYRNYGKVCCFKGYDPSSFAFNTSAPSELFYEQFALLSRLVKLGLDIYCYATFTSVRSYNVRTQMKDFVDRLQEIDNDLPLRTVPLEIKVYTPVQSRMNTSRTASLRNQWDAIRAWRAELSERFTEAQRSRPVFTKP
jgi:uncharacterized Fe-S cluster-containing radical SAM superfamily protein